MTSSWGPWGVACLHYRWGFEPLPCDPLIGVTWPLFHCLSGHSFPILNSVVTVTLSPFQPPSAPLPPPHSSCTGYSLSQACPTPGPSHQLFLLPEKCSPRCTLCPPSPPLRLDSNLTSLRFP